MPVKKARNHFLGKEGCPRFNCSQAVLAALSQDEKTIQAHAEYGSGNAPGGWCGAAYAAAHILQDKKLVEDFFLKEAGAVTCRDIRSLRKLSCIGCVEKSTELAQAKNK